MKESLGIPESVTKRSYREIIAPQLTNHDFLSYDREGNLLVEGISVTDLVKKYGAPLEIVDTRRIEDRCKKWDLMFHEEARKAGFPQEKHLGVYASKANMASEVIMGAIRGGWQIETSGVQDLINLKWLHERGLIDNSLTIFCNGFKPHPKRYAMPLEKNNDRKFHGVIFENKELEERTYGSSYAEMIILMKQAGFNIIPILENEEELDYFAQHKEIESMEVGLRLKFGKVSNADELNKLSSRHGMTLNEARHTADRIREISHLKLTTFHAMVGAAETIPVDLFVDHLLFATDLYFELKKDNPELSFFNMGGGMAPLTEKYNHRDFLSKLLRGVRDKAKKANMETPTIIFEFGSYIAADSGLHVFSVIDRKTNNVDENGKPVSWMIIDGGLMAAIPDMLMIGKEFLIVSANNANKKAIPVIIGDTTCDSDGRYPPKAKGGTIMLPDADDNILVITSVGAYQEQLSGVRGAHHCGLSEAVEIIIEKGRNQATYIRRMTRQTFGDLRNILGYTDEFIKAMRRLH